MKRIFAAILALAAIITITPVRAADPMVVFAAASLKETFDAVGEAYAATGKAKPTFSYAASSALAKQIENGAPAALFVSADEEWMDYLAQRSLIVPPSRVSLLANSLVLIAPADKPFTLKIGKDFALAKTIGSGKLSLADPDSVPAGKYAKAALEKLGVWASVERSVVRGDSVRAALAFVERGEAVAGAVYATDAAVSQKVKVVDTFPADSHPPISYPLAIISGHDGKEAQDFRAFLLTDAAKAIYKKYGFTVK